METPCKKPMRRSFAHMLALTVLLCSGAFLYPTSAASAEVEGVDLDAAGELYRSGQYWESLAASNVAIKQGIYGKEWPILKIRSLLALGKYDEAALEAEPLATRYRISITVLWLTYQTYRQAGEPEKAAEILGRVNQVAGWYTISFWSAEDLVCLGNTALALGADPRQVLETFYDQAKKKDPDSRAAYLATGELALAKYDDDLAGKQFAEGLKRLGPDADFHVGLARVHFDGERSKTLLALQAALKLNPNHTGALLLQAEHLIDSEQYDDATRTLHQILAINPAHSKAWAFHAVIAHLNADEEAERQAREEAFEPWPENPEVDYLIGKKLAQKYRFAESAQRQRAALEHDPKYLPASIQLAQDLLRLGEEESGWELVESVGKQDEYNVVVYNLGNLKNHLEKFVTLKQDGILLRMDPKEAAIYGDRALALLVRAKHVLCEKYGLELTKPVIVEIFPDQHDFAVRTFGMPGGIGYLGVCFGNVITANSPAAIGVGQANWESVLWHEFCHVVTLNLTKNKMPRWLSEGISVYEELQRDARWGQGMTPTYRAMVEAKQFTPIGQLSSAFLNPESPLRLQFAYYQSCLAVEFMIDKYGLDAVQGILRDLAKGVTINTAIETHAAPFDELEGAFATFIQQRADDLAPKGDFESAPDDLEGEELLEWMKDHPNNYGVLGLQAREFIKNEKWEEAQQPLKRLLELYPNCLGSENAYQQLVRVYQELGDAEQEFAILEKLAEKSADDIDTFARLMELANAEEDWTSVVENGQRYLAVQPLLAAPYRSLAEAYEALDDVPQALNAYRRLLQLDPANPVKVRYNLARLLAKSDPQSARRHLLLALADAPRFRDGHRLLFEIRKQLDSASTPKEPAGDSP